MPPSFALSARRRRCKRERDKNQSIVDCPVSASGNFQDRLVPLLSHAHLPHARERDKSAEVAVTHQPKVCDPSAEGLLGHVSRTCTTQVVPARGFEPRTLGLKDRCSNQAELRRLETIVPNFRIPPVLSHLPML